MTEFRVVQPDGSTRWLVHKGFPIRNSRGEAFRFAGFAEDVTAQNPREGNSRDQFPGTAGIGLDLHDGLGQHLVGILCLPEPGPGETTAGKGPAGGGCTAEIADLIREAIAHTRALARGACPVELEADGLAAPRKLAQHTGR